jgi:hypothetical protein
LTTFWQLFDNFLTTFGNFLTFQMTAEGTVGAPTCFICFSQMGQLPTR